MVERNIIRVLFGESYASWMRFAVPAICGSNRASGRLNVTGHWQWMISVTVETRWVYSVLDRAREGLERSALRCVSVLLLEGSGLELASGMRRFKQVISVTAGWFRRDCRTKPPTKPILPVRRTWWASLGWGACFGGLGRIDEYLLTGYL